MAAAIKGDKKIRSTKPKSSDKEIMSKEKKRRMVCAIWALIAVGFAMHASTISAAANAAAAIVAVMMLCAQSSQVSEESIRSYESIIKKMKRKVLKLRRGEIWGQSPSEVFTWSSLVDPGRR